MRKPVLCHMRTTKAQISFIVRCLDSMIKILAKSKISRLYIASRLYGWAGRFESYMVGNPKDSFLVTGLKILQMVSTDNLYMLFIPCHR